MTTQAENHLILIDAARAMHERHRQLLAASRESIAVEYEDLNDSLGQTLECVTAFEFPDDSRLVRDEYERRYKAAVGRERALERKLSAAKGQITKLRNAAKKEQNHAE